MVTYNTQNLKIALFKPNFYNLSSVLTNTEQKKEHQTHPITINTSEEEVISPKRQLGPIIKAFRSSNSLIQLRGEGSRGFWAQYDKIIPERRARRPAGVQLTKVARNWGRLGRAFGISLPFRVLGFSPLLLRTLSGLMVIH